MVYKFVLFVIKIYYSIFFKLEIIGLENIPKEGSAIICSNHISNYDPLTLGISCPRLPRFMAKKELFSVFGLSWLIKQLKAFPVDRGKADMNAFKNAINILKSGEMIGIFAQGTRVKDGEEKAAKAGVALFAIKGESDVIPVCIDGSYKLFSKLTVTYGKPIKLEEYRNRKIKTDELNQITEIIMNAINELKNEES